MPKRKVIEDSDDEEHADTTPPPRPAGSTPNAQFSAVVDLEVSSNTDDVQLSEHPSTGSTGV